MGPTGHREGGPAYEIPRSWQFGASRFPRWVSAPGNWAAWEWGDISDEDALEVLRHAYDQGITFYDTANVYGPGRSEELLGQAFAGMDDVIIATKVAFPMDTERAHRVGRAFADAQPLA